MDKKSRVEKYKKLREEISQMDTYRFDSPYQVDDSENNEEKDVGMSKEELQHEHIKKNTLSISIDQIVKAHDEYTTMISKDDLEKEEKETKKLQFRKLMIRIGIVTAIILIVVLIILLCVILATK